MLDQFPTEILVREKFGVCRFHLFMVKQKWSISQKKDTLSRICQPTAGVLLHPMWTIFFEVWAIVSFNQQADNVRNEIDCLPNSINGHLLKFGGFQPGKTPPNRQTDRKL